MRNAVGVPLGLFASLLGVGAATPTSRDWVISVAAAKILKRIESCFSGKRWASVSKGMASSLDPLYWTHASRQSRSIPLKTAVG